MQINKAFDKTLKIDTKGATLNETSTIPEHKWLVVKDSVVVTEIGNAVPYTNKLENLAEFDAENISTKTLKADQLEVLDSLAYVEFAKAAYVAVCTNTATTAWTSNSVATVTATANMSDKNVRDVVDKMETILIPKYSDGQYRAIVSVNTKRGIYDYLQAVAQYTTPEFRHKNEIGQYYSTRFVQDAQFLSNTKNSIYGEAIFFGQEAVLEAIALLPEVRMKVPTDYGRSKGVAWIAIEAFKKMWNIEDDLNSTGKGISRIVMVTSG